MIKTKTAQAVLEFSFAMIVALVLLMGMVQVFVWSGQDIADRREAHENFLVTDVHGLEQTRPTFYYSTPIGAAVDSSLSGSSGTGMSH